MTEWKDFLESLPEETALVIELTQALEKAMVILEQHTDKNLGDIKATLTIGQEFMGQYVR